MWNLFVYGEKFTDTQAVCKQLSQEIGFPIVTDGEVITWADQRFHMGYNRLQKALSKKSSPLEGITHAKQRTMAYLKDVLAEKISNSSSIYLGLSGHLLPVDLPQVFRLFITADTSYRVQQAYIGSHLSEKMALKEIHRKDESAFRWCRRIYGNESGEENSYHLTLPTDVLDRQSAVQMALDNFRTHMQRPIPKASQAIEDFRLAARVEVLLAESGYPVKVKAKAGKVTVTIEKSVLLLSKLTAKLTKMVQRIEGADKVQIAVGSNFHQADLCCHTNFETSIETQLEEYEKRHARLRKQAIAAIPASLKRSSQRRSLQPGLQLRTAG